VYAAGRSAPPIAQAHGMTVTELALLFNGGFLTRLVELETVRRRCPRY
jgi:uncharacterized protein YbbC (DUF1343 family)